MLAHVRGTAWHRSGIASALVESEDFVQILQACELKLLHVQCGRHYGVRMRWPTWIMLFWNSNVLKGYTGEW